MLPSKHDNLLANLADAKDAYRSNPSEANKAAKADAAQGLADHRATERAGRGGVAVTGDAFATTATEG